MASHTAQFIFFTISISSFIVFILKAVKFEYAEYFTNNYVFKFVVGLLFLYMKIWKFFDDGMIYVTYLCAVFISFYVYDCCCNIAEAANRRVGNKEIFIVPSTVLCLGLIGYTIYLNKYEGSLQISLYHKDESN